MKLKFRTRSLTEVVSPAFRMLLSFFNAVPEKASDRQFFKSMNELMTSAISLKMEFSLDEKEIQEMSAWLSFRSQSGLFQIFNDYFYKLSCLEGATSYSKMWELHYKIKPWVAAISTEKETFENKLAFYNIRTEKRVCPGLMVNLHVDGKIIKKDVVAQKSKLKISTEESADLRQFKITSMSNSKIILVGYPEYGIGNNSLTKLSREDWDALNKSTKALII